MQKNYPEKQGYESKACVLAILTNCPACTEEYILTPGLNYIKALTMIPGNLMMLV